MRPLCVCMSTSQELCWWQMVMSAQKVLCFSGFLAVDCFLKSIFLKTRTKNVSFCFSNYNTRGSALGQNCMNCWCRTLSCASKAGLHDIPSKAVKLCSYMYIYGEYTTTWQINAKTFFALWTTKATYSSNPSFTRQLL